jgi:hypothetical protein
VTILPKTSYGGLPIGRSLDHRANSRNDVGARRGSRRGSAVDPSGQGAGCTHHERTARGDGLVSRALHRVLAKGEGENGIRPGEQRQELLGREITGEADVRGRSRAVRPTREYYLDPGKLCRRLENGVNGFVGVPAAGVDDADLEPWPASVVGPHLCERGRRVVEDDGRAARQAVGELRQGDDDGIGEARRHGEAPPRPAGSRAEDGRGVRVDDYAGPGEPPPDNCQQHQRQGRRHDHKPVRTATDEKQNRPEQLHRITPEHRPATAEPAVRDEHRIAAELLGETRAAPVVADPGDNQRARRPTHNRTTDAAAGAALRVSKTMSLAAATASRSIAACGVSTTARS